MFVAVSGPGVAGIVMTYVEQGREGGRDFWRRAIDIRHIRARWWRLSLLAWPALHGLAIGLNALAGGPPPAFAFVREIAARPATALVVPVLYFLQAALEELGWRGYMLDRLQDRFGPLRASLILGICHGLWHLPLFWVVGTNQIAWGFGVDFWLFLMVVQASSVYSTWCYNDNGRSTFAAIVLHFTYNIYLDLFASPEMQQRIFQAITFLAIALTAVVMRVSARRRGSEARFQHGDPDRPRVDHRVADA